MHPKSRVDIPDVIKHPFPILHSKHYCALLYVDIRPQSKTFFAHSLLVLLITAPLLNPGFVTNTPVIFDHCTRWVGLYSSNPLFIIPEVCIILRFSECWKPVENDFYISKMIFIYLKCGLLLVLYDSLQIHPRKSHTQEELLHIRNISCNFEVRTPYRHRFMGVIDHEAAKLMVFGPQWRNFSV